MSYHPIEFQASIKEVCRHTILKYYRPDLDLILESGASKVAMGMASMPDFSQEPGFFGIKFIDVTGLEPMAFASKTLTPQTVLS